MLPFRYFHSPNQLLTLSELVYKTPISIYSNHLTMEYKFPYKNRRLIILIYATLTNYIHDYWNEEDAVGCLRCSVIQAPSWLCLLATCTPRRRDSQSSHASVFCVYSSLKLHKFTKRVSSQALPCDSAGKVSEGPLQGFSCLSGIF